MANAQAGEVRIPAIMLRSGRNTPPPAMPTSCTHRRVKRQHQHVRACGLSTLDQVKADGVIVLGEAIELEPENIRGNLGDFLDRRTANGAKCIGYTRPLGSPGESLVSTWPYHNRG